MLGIVGTIPDEEFPLIGDTVSLDGNFLSIGNERIAIHRGTPAMIAAAVQTLNYLDQPSPFCYLVGDIGSGQGSKRLYQFLTDNIMDYNLGALTLHYFQPDVKLFKAFLSSVNTMTPRPTLIGDAGFMYVAKMGGDAASFDLFTPDIGELAYLADEKSPHPFYTRGFILHEQNHVPDLIQRAYRYNNASAYMLVKGAIDYIADKNGVIAQVDEPNVEVLEAIGGTGDTLTGIVSALIAAGMDIESASVKAAKANRLAGLLAKPTPATQVSEIIKQIPAALNQISGVVPAAVGGAGGNSEMQ